MSTPTFSNGVCGLSCKVLDLVAVDALCLAQASQNLDSSEGGSFRLVSSPVL